MQGTRRAEVCLFGRSALFGQSALLLLFLFFPVPSFLEVASEHFKCSKNKTEGENKPLWNVAEG